MYPLISKWAVPVMLLPGLVAAGPKLLTAQCEEALALSALPERLRADASVWTLTADGFRKTRKRDGVFTCIVERNHPEALIPQCVDAAGAETIVPSIIQKSRWALEGLSVGEVKKRFQKLVAMGDVKPASRPGLSYMISDYNYAWSEQRGDFFKIPPHVMFYAPQLTNEDIGGSIEEGTRTNRGMPFVIETGIHGYMTSFVEHASDSADVAAACRGQLEQRLPVAHTNHRKQD